MNRWRRMSGLAGVGLAIALLAVPVAAEETELTMVEVRRSGGFDAESLSLIDDAVRAVRADRTELHRVTLRLLLLTRADRVIQEPPRGFGYPMVTMAIDPAMPVMAASLRVVLSRGDAVVGATSASLRGAEVGDILHLESLAGETVQVRIGAIVPDEEIGWSEILVGRDSIPRLGIDRPYAVVAWTDRGAPLAAAIRIWTADPQVRVLDGTGDPGTDPVLPVAAVKERFGEFAVRPAGGDAVQVDPGWRNSSIVTTDLPIVGPTRCHRLLVPYLRAALGEVDRAGLAGALDPNDFQLAGGCYNPRFNRGADPGFSLSRHTWGIAIDFNPTSNPYGAAPVLAPGIVQIFKQWGFSWGGNWSVPDGMHFEWWGFPIAYDASCGLTTPTAATFDAWRMADSQGVCT
ncbi:MAG TPA: M15 family metallopeptidase [Acidimicrobiia bacterium]|nr:M15 family metallopeptidase [Acidimicrobiia bacterium]